MCVVVMVVVVVVVVVCVVVVVVVLVDFGLYLGGIQTVVIQQCKSVVS